MQLYVHKLVHLQGGKRLQFSNHCGGYIKVTKGNIELHIAESLVNVVPERIMVDPDAKV